MIPLTWYSALGDCLIVVIILFVASLVHFINKKIRHKKGLKIKKLWG